MLVTTKHFALSAIVVFLSFNLFAQNLPSKHQEINELCADEGFEIQVYTPDFDTYRYQKAFLNFDRIDQFRKLTQSSSYVIENGEAEVILASASSIQSKRPLKCEPMGDQLPPLRFVLNVNGQVKEQPLN